MGIYYYSDDLMMETVSLFLESEYKSRIRAFDLEFDTFNRKYPELKSAGKAINSIKKDLAVLSQDPYVEDYGTMRRIVHICNTIFDVWHKFNSWWSLIRLGGTAAGTLMGGPVLGIAIMSFDQILLRLFDILIETFWQSIFVEMEHELAAATLKDMIMELNVHKADCLRRKDKANAATCDKLIRKANDALERLYK